MIACEIQPGDWVAFDAGFPLYIERIIGDIKNHGDVVVCAVFNGQSTQFEVPGDMPVNLIQREEPDA